VAGGGGRGAGGGGGGGGGVTRSTDDWEAYAKALKAGAERRAEENKRAKVGDDVDRQLESPESTSSSELSLTEQPFRQSILFLQK
jgi:hypothetical protein